MEWIDEFLADDKPQGNKASLWTLSSLESLLSGAAISYEEREILERMDFESMPADEVYKIIDYLKERQLDPISNGMRYTMTDINKHLKKLE